VTINQSKKIKELSAILNAIKRKCLDCSAFSNYELRYCNFNKCPLYPYRFGKLPDPKNPLLETSYLTKNDKPQEE